MNTNIQNYKDTIENISSLKTKLSGGLKNNILSIKTMSQSRTGELLGNNSNGNPLLLESPFIIQNGYIDQTAILDPIILRDVENKKNGIRVMSTKEMGKACFIEHESRIDDQQYNFIQYKGIGINPTLDLIKSLHEPEKGNEVYIIGDKEETVFPFFIFKTGGNFHARFYGSAYYEDIILEEKNSQKIIEATNGKIRTLKVIKNIKFSKEFAKNNNIPIPTSDDVNNMDGDDVKTCIRNMKKSIISTMIDSGIAEKEAEKKYEDILNSYESGDYYSAILGQNIRASKNIFRVSDLIGAINKGDTEYVIQILDTSKKILSKEFIKDYQDGMSDVEYIKKFAGLLGEQAGLFIDKKIIHGNLKAHRQDISLAAEICDFDGSNFFDSEYIEKKKNDPKSKFNEIKNKEERKNAIEYWEKYVGPNEFYRQIFYIWSHVYPVFHAIKTIKNIDLKIEEIIDKYLEGLFSNLSEDSKKEMIEFLKIDERNDGSKGYNPKFASTGGMTNNQGIYTNQVKDNDIGDKDIFEIILGKIKSKLE